MTVLTPDNAGSFAGLSFVNDDSPPGMFMALYGTGGGGKTTTASEAVLSPHASPGLLVNVDGSFSSVLHLREKGLDIVTPTTWAQVKAITRMIDSGDHKYKSIIWDNLTELQTLCLKVKAPSGFPEGSDALKVWGTTNAECMEFVRKRRDVAVSQGLHTFIILWEEVEKDDLTGLIRRKVQLTNKFSTAFPGMATMVGRITVPGKAPHYTRLLSFAPSEQTDAKFRVAPTDAAVNIPLELYLNKDTHFVVDFLAATIDGVKFPSHKYAKPVTAVTAKEG